MYGMYVSEKFICKDNKKRRLGDKKIVWDSACRFNKQSYKKVKKEIRMKATFAVFGLTNIECRVICYRIID